MYLENIDKLTMNIGYVAKLNKLAEWRGLYKDGLGKKDEFKTKSLLHTVIATSEIEGISVGTISRATELILDPKPLNKTELEFSKGVKLNKFIFSDYENIIINKANICNLHKMLMEGIDKTSAGKIVGGKVVAEYNHETKENRVIHYGSDSTVVEQHVDKLIDAYNHYKGKVPSFVLSSLFVAELLSIHPFNDGNGRLARALFNLLLMQNNYFISKVSSIDKVINERKVEYYQTLEKRSKDWNEKKYDVNANLNYIYLMIDIVYDLYQDYNSKQELSKEVQKVGKRTAVIEIINSLDNFSAGDILETLNHSVSRELVSKLLSELVSNNKLIKEGKGKGTIYKKA